MPERCPCAASTVMYKEEHGKGKEPSGLGAMEENTVLCAASAYEQKYYLNPDFEKMPESVKEELQIISVLFVEEIGGRFIMEFDENGVLKFRTEALDSDYNYDDIGAALMIKEIRKNRMQLLSEVTLFYRVMILKQPLEEAAAALEGEEE